MKYYRIKIKKEMWMKCIYIEHKIYFSWITWAKVQLNQNLNSWKCNKILPNNLDSIKVIRFQFQL